jgi:uncharacterized membrane protein
MEENTSESLPTNRIEGLSDGVFGIAMTILIFKLDVPDGIMQDNMNKVIQDKLFNMIPQFENYFISFILLGLYWTRHQLQFKHIRQADRNLLWINIFFLVFVGLLPFTTGMLMKYTGLEIPQFLYSLNLMLIGLALAIHWIYASANYRLISKDLTKEFIRRYTMLTLSPVVVFAICCVIAVISPRTSLTLMYIIPLFFLVVKIVEKKKRRR